MQTLYLAIKNMVLTDVNNSNTEQFSKYQTAGPWILYWIRGKLTDLQTCSPASLHLDSIFYIKHLR